VHRGRRGVPDGKAIDRAQARRGVDDGLNRFGHEGFIRSPRAGLMRKVPILAATESINQHQHRCTLRRLHHVLKLPVSRDWRFELGRNCWHNEQQ